MTWSPFFTRVTPAPTSTTTPAPSWPRIEGKRPSGSAPERVNSSVWQMPVALISIRTSPARGPSRRTVSIVSGAPARWATAARMSKVHSRLRAIDNPMNRERLFAVVERQPLRAQELMDERDRHAAFADGRRNALHRPVPHVAGREDPRNARLEQEGITVEWPRSLLSRDEVLDVAPRANESLVIADQWRR